MDSNKITKTAFDNRPNYKIYNARPRLRRIDDMQRTWNMLESGWKSKTGDKTIWKFILKRC